MLLAIWSRDRRARPGGADTSALWRSFQGMSFTEWISLHQMINFIMDCIWLYAISSGVSWMSSYIYIFKVFMYIIPQFRSFYPYGSVAKSQSSRRYI